MLGCKGEIEREIEKETCRKTFKKDLGKHEIRKR
jgi:hypothetical protein